MPVVSKFIGKDTWFDQSATSKDNEEHADYRMLDYRITHVDGKDVMNVDDCVMAILRKEERFTLTFAPPVQFYLS